MTLRLRLDQALFVLATLALASAGCVFELPALDESLGGAGGAGGGAAGSGGGLGCEGRFQDCNGFASDGCETDTYITTAHCGACGRDCLETSCSEGRCSPTPIYQGTPNMLACILAMDEANVYSYDMLLESIVAVPKSGAPHFSLALGDPGPWDLVADDTHLYLTRSMAPDVYRMAKTGGAVETVATTSPLPRGLVAGSTHVYWFNDGDTRALRRAAKGVGSAVETLVDPAGMYSADGIAVDAERVYWSSDAEQSIRSVTKAGDDLQELVSGVEIWQGLRLDASHVYFIDWPARSISKVLKVGGALTVLADISDSSTFEIEIDEAEVYAIDDQTLWKLPKAGGERTILADGSDLGCALEVETIGPYAYYVDKAAGRIFRVVK